MGWGFCSPVQAQVWLPNQSPSANSFLGINTGATPAARLHISDESSNCAPAILINAFDGIGDPNQGPSGPETENDCLTPYVFRATRGTLQEITSNIAANGKTSLGAVWNYSAAQQSHLSVQHNLGLYRSNTELVRLGYPAPNTPSLAPKLHWYDAESRPFHFAFGNSWANSENLMSLLPNGRLGIGTETPEALLHVKSELANPNSNETGQIQGLLIENNGWRDHDFALEVRTGQANDFGGRIFTVSNAGTVHIGPNLNGAIPDMGEGTFNLYVEKGIRTERVRVDVAAENGWADYVFDDDYVLMPIAELEAYIKEHKHLPGVPSAATVAEEGIDLAEMNKILLEKVEELTLRLIEQEKRLADLEN